MDPIKPGSKYHPLYEHLRQLGEDQVRMDFHGLEQLIEMLRRDRMFDGGLPRKALIDAFRVVEDPELVGRYRRRMASLLF